MCDFEDMPVISKYTRQQAVDDGILVQILSWDGRPVMATAGIRDDFGLSELLAIWHEFRAWKDKIEPTLPEENRLFATGTKNGKVWIIEDSESFTLMYPHEY